MLRASRRKYTYRLNAYEFRVYQLNDRSTSKTDTMNKGSNETLDYVIRRGKMLMVNGSSNSYAVNLSTLEGAQFNQKVSYMSVVDDNLVSCNDLDGTISIYDSISGEEITDLPDGTEENLEVNGAFMVEDGLLKKYSYEKTDKSAEELEPVYTEEVPENCTQAYISLDDYLIETLEETDEVSTICILDPDRKEVFSQKCTDFRGSAECKYILYQPEGGTQYIMYNYVTGKEITSFAAPEGLPYFAMLYLSDSGETRLDIYSKDATASPVAKIKGGLGMNEEGEVVIFDGVHTLYAVPFLSLSETYEKGKEFLNGENLTQEQKIAYHCD